MKEDRWGENKIYRWADSIGFGCFTACLVSHCLYPSVRVLSSIDRAFFHILKKKRKKIIRLHLEEKKRSHQHFSLVSLMKERAGQKPFLL